MKERLARIVADLAADYADIRYEENKKTRVAYRGKRLELVSSYATSGGHVRVYADGGMRALPRQGSPPRGGIGRSGSPMRRSSPANSPSPRGSIR